jgi:hypothetical protein
MSVLGVNINGSILGNSLQEMLTAQEIQPGDQPSYSLCKTIYMYHPLGSKMAESPIAMAQSQKREISVPNSPEDRVRNAFTEQHEKDGIDDRIMNVMALSRVYGIASIAALAGGVAPNVPLDSKKLWEYDIAWNVLDPLNTAGSLVLNQDANALDFQKVTAISVSGVPYHRSRSITVMNERPIYIGYTSSAFGYVGRSVYQRALFPLKSFVQTMVTDDMVSRKAGVLIAKLKQPGSIIDNLMQTMAGIKRALLKEAATNNVISVSTDEDIETLNMQNLDGAYSLARKNILENIAVAADMPAKLLNSETFAEGFGEGTEDAKNVARFIDRIREQMNPLYRFFDRFTMHRAWNPEFYKIIQSEFSEYKGVPYERAFFQWQNSFATEWPSLLTEPPSEKIKVDDVKLKAIIAMLEVLMPALDPDNKAAVIAWAQDNFNELKLLFQNPLLLDFDALEAYVPPAPPASLEEPKEPKPFAAQDAQPRISRARRAIERLDAAENDLFATVAARESRAKSAMNGRAGMNGRAQ